MTLPVAELSFGSLSPLPAAMLAVAALAYARRARTLGARGKAVPRRRIACFAASVAFLLLVPLSPLGASDEESFASHMIEHLLIGDLAALLMVLGITGPLIAPLLKLGPIARLRGLAHPLVALPLWLINLYAWHLPFLMNGANGSETVHVVQHLLFFGCGLNMWLPLFGPLPRPAWFNNVAMLLYIVVVRLAGVALGNIFMFSGRVYYEIYRSVGRNLWGLSPLADQSVAGAVMMTEGTLVTFALFGWLFVKAARESDQSQELIDLAAEHGVELSGARSARAAAAGAAELLRERILEAGEPPPNGKT